MHASVRASSERCRLLMVTIYRLGAKPLARIEQMHDGATLEAKNVTDLLFKERRN